MPAQALPERSDGVVAIRVLQSAHAEAHLVGEDAEMRRWFRFPKASNLQIARDWIEASRVSFLEGGPRRNFGIFVLGERGADEVVGTCEVNDLLDGTANISYSVHARFRRQGIASRAVGLLLAYAADAMAPTVAIIRCEPQNYPSIGVARRCGFALEREYVDDTGTPMLELRRAVTGRGPNAQGSGSPVA